MQIAMCRHIYTLYYYIYIILDTHISIRYVIRLLANTDVFKDNAWICQNMFICVESIYVNKLPA